MSTDFPQLSWINKFYNIMLYFFFFDAKFSIKVCVFGHFWQNNVCFSLPKFVRLSKVKKCLNLN